MREKNRSSWSYSIKHEHLAASEDLQRHARTIKPIIYSNKTQEKKRRKRKGERQKNEGKSGGCTSVIGADIPDAHDHLLLAKGIPPLPFAAAAAAAFIRRRGAEDPGESRVREGVLEGDCRASGEEDARARVWN